MRKAVVFLGLIALFSMAILNPSMTLIWLVTMGAVCVIFWKFWDT